MINNNTPMDIGDVFRSDVVRTPLDIGDVFRSDVVHILEGRRP